MIADVVYGWLLDIRVLQREVFSFSTTYIFSEIVLFVLRVHDTCLCHHGCYAALRKNLCLYQFPKGVLLLQHGSFTLLYGLELQIILPQLKQV